MEKGEMGAVGGGIGRNCVEEEGESVVDGFDAGNGAENVYQGGDGAGAGEGGGEDRGLGFPRLVVVGEDGLVVGSGDELRVDVRLPGDVGVELAREGVGGCRCYRWVGGMGVCVHRGLGMGAGRGRGRGERARRMGFGVT